MATVFQFGKNKAEQDWFDRSLDIVMCAYGPLMAGDHLIKMLGFPSSAALRKAQSRGKLPVKLFSMPHRHMKFAFAPEVLAWLINQRLQYDDRPLDLGAISAKVAPAKELAEFVKTHSLILSENDLVNLLKLDDREQLSLLHKAGKLPLPIFQIEGHRDSFFAMTLEALLLLR